MKHKRRCDGCGRPLLVNDYGFCKRCNKHIGDFMSEAELARIQAEREAMAAQMKAAQEAEAAAKAEAAAAKAAAEAGGEAPKEGEAEKKEKAEGEGKEK